MISNSKSYSRILSVSIIALLMIMVAITPLSHFIMPSSGRILSGMPTEPGYSACIWTTDEYGNPKTDFAPGDIVYIHGTGFLSWHNVDIDITRPNCIVESGSTATNLFGSLVYEYDLNGILGFYFVVASDGINSAQTIFTDNHGAIWTTRDDCGDQQQDVNHYDIGDHVFINGRGFTPEAEYEWFIKGKPGGASCDPNIIVASGTVIANESGAFCFDAYEVQPDDCGEYSVKVDSKNDNYHVNAPWPDEPNVDIEKQVWNASTLSWMDSAVATVCTNLSFRINVTNTGNVDLTNVIVVDNLPSFLNYKYDASPPPSSASDHQIIWNLGTLTVGSCQLLTFSAHVDACGFGDNVANATTDNGVYDEDYISVEGLPIPSVDVEKKIWDPDTQSWVESIDTSAGSTVRFNISIHNDGICSGLMGITVIDTLPPSLGYADDATPREPDDISPDGKQLTWSFPGPFLVCNWIYIEFNATVLYCGELDINVVNVSAQCMITSETVYDEDTASVFGLANPGVDIEKQVWDESSSSWVDSITATVCTNLSFRINVTNTGNVDLTNVIVVDNLPSFLNYKYDASPPPSSASDHQIIWNLGTLTVGSSQTLTFTAHVDAAGEGDNVANVNADEKSVSDEDTVHVIGEEAPTPCIDVEKWVSDDNISWYESVQVAVGGTVYWKIWVKNCGDVTLTNVMINDLNGQSYGPFVMLSGDELTFYYITTAAVDFINIATGTGTDPVGGTVSDSDSAEVTIIAPCIDVDKAVWNGTDWVDDIRVPIGTDLKFRIIVYNCGEIVLTGITVTDNLSSHLEYRNNANHPEYYVSPDLHQVIWHFDQLNPGETIEITYHAETVHNCYGWNIVNVTTDQDVYDSAEVTVKTTPEGQPVIDITKQVWHAGSSSWVDSIRRPLWTDLTFKITVNSSALETVHDVIVTDNLPEQLEYRNDANYPEESVSDDMHQVVWKFDTMEPGEKIEITYHAGIVKEGWGDNLATVTTNELYYDMDSVLVLAVDFPIVQLIYPTGGETLSGTITIQWFAIDSSDPLLDIYLFYSANDGRTWRRISDVVLHNYDNEGHGEYEWSTTSLSDGYYLLKVEAVNNYNALACDDSKQFAIVNGIGDVKVSDVRITDKDTGSVYWVKNGATVEISAGITGGLHLDSEDIIADLGGFSKGINVPAYDFDGFTATWILNNVDCSPSDGHITVTVTADGINSNSATITADNTLPELTVIKPENALYFFNAKLFATNKPIIIGAITLEATIYDTSGIQKTEIYIDDELEETLTGGSQWYMNLRLMGRHTLKIVACDNAENTNVYSQTVIIYNPFGEK